VANGVQVGEAAGAIPYIDHIRNSYDQTQSAAIEACASLVVSPVQLRHFATSVANAGGNGDQKKKEEVSLLPVVLLQGPPGTGKTHTVTVWPFFFIYRLRWACMIAKPEFRSHLQPTLFAGKRQMSTKQFCCLFKHSKISVLNDMRDVHRQALTAGCHDQHAAPHPVQQACPQGPPA
jgi:hypothetical protein